jgi:acetylornithine/succinyldiaminopimelate/putrescine aminotransferase
LVNAATGGLPAVSYRDAEKLQLVGWVERSETHQISSLQLGRTRGTRHCAGCQGDGFRKSSTHPTGCEALQVQGILAKDTHEHTIRIAPPLVITSDEVDWALGRFATVLTQDFS